MVKGQIILLIGLACVPILILASEMNEDEDVEVTGSCYPAFDQTYVDQFKEATMDCLYKPMRKTKETRIKKLGFRKLKNKQKKYGPPVASVQDCHFQCFTFAECQAFRFEFIPVVEKCKSDDLEDCNGSKCDLLRGEITTGEGDALDERYIYGEKDICLEPLSTEAKDYFKSPDTRLEEAKTDFLNAKQEYDPESKESIDRYSSLATNCLGPLISSGDISEDEIGIAQSVIAGKLPYLPRGPSLSSTQVVRITPRDVGSGTFWVFTGLYALPGTLITVRTPSMAVPRISIRIGANKDQIYHRGDGTLRDPQVSMLFNITSQTQVIGSAYGGLIIVVLEPNDASDNGTTFEIEFDNIIEAPLFNLETDTNADWNNRIKNKPGPWTVFRIPQKITWVLPTEFVRNITDVTTNLEEYEAYMDAQDYASCVVDRKKAEVVVPDVMVSGGKAHSGYPIGTMFAPALRGEVLFPPGGTINHVDMPLGIGHEIGHNVSPLDTGFSHVAINMFFHYALPETRVSAKGGIWGREERLFEYIQAGMPSILDTKEYNLVSEIIKMPMDGQDGLGWEDEGNWEDMHDISCIWKNEESVTEDVFDKWALVVCKATEMNLMEYWNFWNFPTSSNTTDVCNGYGQQPSKMMSWIQDIEELAAESVESCEGMEGWFGHGEKCFHWSETKMNRKAAVQYCHEMGGELATVDSREDAIIINHSKNRQESKIRSAWILTIPAPAEVFPYGRLDVEAPGFWILDEALTPCSYNPLAKDGADMSCLQPGIAKGGRRTRFAVCQVEVLETLV